MDIITIVSEYKENKRKFRFEGNMLELLKLYLAVPDDIKSSVLTDMPMSSSYGKKTESFVLKKELLETQILKQAIIIKEYEILVLEFEQKIESLDELERHIIINKYFAQKKLTNWDIISSFDGKVSKRTFERSHKSAKKKILN